jgi:hypothetical protein
VAREKEKEEERLSLTILHPTLSLLPNDQIFKNRIPSPHFEHFSEQGMKFGEPFCHRRHPNLCDKARYICGFSPPHLWNLTVQPKAYHRGCPTEFLPGWGKNCTKRKRGSTQFTTTPVAGGRSIHQALPDL